MAKKWTPSQKQLQLYDELLKRQNITRKRLLRRRRIAEEEGSSGRPLPDLVIPQRARRSRNIYRYANLFDSYADYRNKMKELSRLYGGKGSPLKAWYKETYRNNILSMIEDWIKNKIGFTEPPADPYREGQKNNYYYSDIQIKDVGDKDGRILELYNYLKSLNINMFMALYDLHSFPSLHIIYDDITSRGQFAEIDSFIDGFTSIKREVVKTRAYRKLVEDETMSNRKDYIDSYKLAVENRSQERLDEIKSNRYKERKII